MTGSWSGEMKKVWRRLSPFSADEGGSSWRRRAAGLAPEAKAAGSTTNSNLIGTDNPIHSPRIQVVAKFEPWFFPNQSLRRDSIHKVHISEEVLWACVCNKSCLRSYSGTWLRRASCTEKFGVSGFTLGLLFYKSFVHQNTILNAIPQWFGLKRGLGFVLLKKKVCLL